MKIEDQSSADVKEYKYLQLAEHFRDRIARRELQPGDRLPTFAAMRAHFGATPATVERMLSLLEREGLVERRPHNGIFVMEPRQEASEPEVLPQSPKTNYVLGCIMPSIESGENLPFWTAVLGGYQDGALRIGAQLMLFHSESMQGWDKIDGILCPGGTPWYELEDQIRLCGVPSVVTFEPGAPLRSVASDDADGIRQAMEHLLGLGHRKIAFMIHTEDEVPVSRIRLASYYECLMHAGIVPDPRWVHHLVQGHSFIVRGQRSMRQWLEQDWRELGCTALLVQNDRAAIGAMEILHAHGIQVPGDVSVVGYDGTEEGQMSNPPLTSVQLPLREMGVRAVEMLAEQIREPRSIQVQNLFPVRLVVRESTAQPRAS